MKKAILVIGLFAFFGNIVIANGVVFKKAGTGSYLTLIESSIRVKIESQVSNTVTTQVFRNNFEDSLAIKYAFPLPQNASATKLRYKINGLWYTANFAPVPQDTSTGGGPGEVDNILKQYVGTNPLYFEIAQRIDKDSSIVIELTYVELLNYKFGRVNYLYPNKYGLIQTNVLAKQEFNLVLNSARTIENIELLSHIPGNLTNTGNQATLSYIGYESAANADYFVQYSLSLSELGLYSLSTYLPDSTQKDSFGRGFFTFIVEPDPSEAADVIKKVFTLIIDNSGSMGGDKIVQARDAARFIVENLNEGDMFNIISFSTEVTSFRSSHVEFDATSEESAIAYINSLQATELTNISGAFDVAVPQFSYADSNTANIIIFFTDGEQTTGITDTDQLIGHINNLITKSEKQISLFTFGIGEYVNERLLTSIANKNNGVSQFLMNNELEEVITNFYLMIRNPVLLNTRISFTPSVIREIYPAVIPNLYKGQQMILVGRYNEACDLKTNLTGNAFSNNVNYEYSISLSDTFDNELQFLAKLWAKSKMDYLIDQYYLNLNNSGRADSIKKEIIGLSIDYGVISPFTSFQGGDPGNGSTVYFREYQYPDTKETGAKSNKYLEIESVYPNPCQKSVNVVIHTRDDTYGNLSLKLVNAQGKHFYSLTENVVGHTTYSHNLNLSQLNVESGVYFILVQFNDEIITYQIIVE
jgi:Ca-activated chloride channel family protein